MIEVIPGVYRLKIPIPHPSLKHVNTYLVREDNKCLLIDTGWNTEEALASLEKQLSGIGIGIKDISRIVLTHVHPDHYGLAGRLKQLSPAKLALHYLEKDLIESRYVNMDKLLQQLGQWLRINGVPADELPALQTVSVGMAKFVAAAAPDITLRGGETISVGSFNFEVIWTPGHSPGHISLYEPARKILISGDHILPTITPNIALHPQSGSNPLADYLNSLNRLRQRQVSLILPGHERPFTGLESRIAEIIQHHKQRNSEILEAIKPELKTAYQISTEMTWSSGTGWSDLSPLDKRMAILETLAHLESMRLSKKVARFSKDSLIYYQPAKAIKYN